MGWSVHACGKSLIAGSYLLLSPGYSGISIALDARMHVTVREAPLLHARVPECVNSSDQNVSPLQCRFYYGECEDDYVAVSHMSEQLWDDAACGSTRLEGIDCLIQIEHVDPNSLAAVAISTALECIFNDTPILSSESDEKSTYSCRSPHFPTTPTLRLQIAGDPSFYVSNSSVSSQLETETETEIETANERGKGSGKGKGEEENSTMTKSGLGSSAALAVAMVAAVYCVTSMGEPAVGSLSCPLEVPEAWFVQAWASIAHQRWQGGRGSCFDVATAVHGSVLYTTPVGMRQLHEDYSRRNGGIAWTQTVRGLDLVPPSASSSASTVSFNSSEITTTVNAVAPQGQRHHRLGFYLIRHATWRGTSTRKAVDKWNEHFQQHETDDMVVHYAKCLEKFCRFHRLASMDMRGGDWSDTTLQEWSTLYSAVQDSLQEVATAFEMHSIIPTGWKEFKQTVVASHPGFLTLGLLGAGGEDAVCLFVDHYKISAEDISSHLPAETVMLPVSIWTHGPGCWLEWSRS